MTDREKLVELMKAQPCLNSDCNYCEENGAYCELYKMADFFIANGVTFAKDTDVPTKWISVKERLPETQCSCIVLVKYKYSFEKEYNYDTDVATFYPDRHGYIDGRWDTYVDWDEGQQYLHVTHWMPMPEPPKEE